MTTFSPVRRLTLIAVLAAVGIALFVIESYIPMPLPFLKIGLANISSVVALVLIGTTSMMGVVLLRVVLGALLVGTFMSPAFLLALSAGVVSALVMGLARKLTRTLFSVVGISLIGAFTHSIVQLIIVRYVYVQTAVVLHLLPFLLGGALVGGLIVGAVSLRLMRALPEVLR